MGSSRLYALLTGAAALLQNVRGDALTSKFNVLVPKTLNKAEGYDHRDAMFGIPPYGGSIQQQVVYARSTLCDGPDKDKWDHGGDVEPPFILLVDRGDCSFVQKVRNSQRGGASAVLIADDICICGRGPECPEASGGVDPESGESYFCETTEPIMADDGSGSDISIPSFLLFKEDAEPIKDALVKGQPVRVQMSFSVPAPDSRVEYDLWTSPADALTRELQEDFFSAVTALQEHASFTPHMYIYDGIYAGCHDQNSGQDLCLDLCTNAGRYCSVDLDLNSGASGAEVVTEALRRICVWNLYGKDNGIGLQWWEYVRKFTETCDSGTFDMDGALFSDENCIAKAMEASGVDKAKVDECMQASGGTEGDVVNTLLNKELADQATSGVVLVPSLFVNQAIIRGFLNFETTFKAICAGFASGSEPPICQTCANCPEEKACVQGGACGTSNLLFGASSVGSVSMPAFAGSVGLLLLVFVVIGYVQFVRQQNYMRQEIQSVVQEYMPIGAQNAEASTSVALDEDEAGYTDDDTPQIS